MRILHILAYKTWGGGESQTLNLAQGLQDLQVKQMLVCAKDSKLALKAQERAIPIQTFKKRHNFSLLSSLELANVIRAFKPDIVHVHDVLSHNYLSIAKLFHRPTYKVIFSRRLTLPLRNNFLNRLKFNAKEFYGFIAVSRAVRKSIYESFPNKNTSVIPEGIELAPYRYRRRHISSNVLRVGFVGRLSPEKNPMLLLEVAKICNQKSMPVTFVVAGTGPLEADMQIECQKLGLNDRVQFLGFVNDVAALLKNIDVLLVPSICEAFCITILEAMAAETIVVAAKTGGIPELIEDKVSGYLVSPNQAEHYVDVLAQFLQEENLEQEIRDNASKHVSQFDKTHMCQQVLKLYKNILPIQNTQMQ